MVGVDLFPERNVMAYCRVSREVWISPAMISDEQREEQNGGQGESVGRLLGGQFHYQG